MTKTKPYAHLKLTADDIAIYLRVSDPDKEKKLLRDLGRDFTTEEVIALTFQTQLASCKEKLEELGLPWPKDIHIYKECHTGTDWENRPVFNLLRSNVENRRYKFVIVWKLDRLGRDYAYQIVTLDKWQKKCGCEVISATEDFSDKSPQGKLMRQTLAMFAEFERAIIFERTQTNKQTIIKSGKLTCSGRARLGYKYEKKTRSRIIVQEEAGVVLRIFEMAASGMSPMSIATQFNQERVKTPSQWKGRRSHSKPIWRHDVVYAILRDRSYIGEPMVQCKEHLVGEVRTNGKKLQQPRPESEHITSSDPTPRIVPDDLWHRAHEALPKSATGTETRNREFPRLLRGWIFCGVCGRPMTISGSYGAKTPNGERKPLLYYACQSKYKHYRKEGETSPCGNKLTPADWADELVFDQFYRFMSDREAAFNAVREGWKKYGGVDRDVDGDIQLHQEAITGVSKAITKLVSTFGDDEDELVQASIKQQITTLKAQADSHRKAIKELEDISAKKITLESTLAEMDEVWRKLETMRGRHNDLQFETKRKLMALYGLRITARGRDLDMHLAVEVVGSVNKTLSIDMPLPLVLLPQGFAAKPHTSDNASPVPNLEKQPPTLVRLGSRKPGGRTPQQSPSESSSSGSLRRRA